MSQTDKITVVTGATSGIGREIARGLARTGAHVVIPVRDAGRGEQTRAELAAEPGAGAVTVMKLDVSDLASVRAFAREFSERFPALHVLVNNAGVWFSDRRTAPGGHELTLMTNVVGPHLLTQLLEPKLRAAGKARVVNLVSDFASNYDSDDLDYSKRKFDGFKAYGQSKLAMRMLTWGAATRLAETGITVNAAAPGFVKTNFNQNTKGFMARMIDFSAMLFAVSAAKGADTPLWVATAPELDGVTGKLFAKRKEKDGKFREPDAIAKLERACEAIEAEQP